ncbi:MAG: nicotinate (nicotinamide) nucleotide adenylyltransferase [Rhodoferax sp.]|nr:nicotinate (nicotinamide) nucleotide adenylyltransferase [Rhodoferax sp.]
MTAPRRVGVFGGSFDPPHNMHVALVRAAVAQLGLDEMRVFPTGHAWHKSRTLSAAEHRLAMAQLAFGRLPRVVVDPREINRTGPTYTIDTLRELQAEQPGASLYLVMGADQARALPTWHAAEALLQTAIISVAARSEASDQDGPFNDRFDATSLPPPWNAGRFEALQLPPMAVSATDIRQRLGASQGIAHLVPDGVARYIDQHHLYRTAR